jgi:hypothetical protein
MLGRTWEYDAAGNPTSHLTRDAFGGIINSMEHVNGNWQDPVYYHEGSYVYAQTDTNSAVVDRRQFTATGHLFGSASEAFYSSDQTVYQPKNPHLNMRIDALNIMSNIYLAGSPLEANLDIKDICGGFDPDMVKAPGFGGFVSGSEGQEGYFFQGNDTEWLLDSGIFPEFSGGNIFYPNRVLYWQSDSQVCERTGTQTTTGISLMGGPYVEQTDSYQCGPTGTVSGPDENTPGGTEERTTDPNTGETTQTLTFGGAEGSLPYDLVWDPDWGAFVPKWF